MQRQTWNEDGWLETAPEPEPDEDTPEYIAYWTRRLSEARVSVTEKACVACNRPAPQSLTCGRVLCMNWWCGLEASHRAYLVEYRALMPVSPQSHLWKGVGQLAIGFSLAALILWPVAVWLAK